MFISSILMLLDRLQYYSHQLAAALLIVVLSPSLRAFGLFARERAALQRESATPRQSEHGVARESRRCAVVKAFVREEHETALRGRNLQYTKSKSRLTTSFVSLS
jgi:hypothetical protein